MNKFYSLLGLCKKAGKLVGGEELVENTVRQKKACLLILAVDVSNNTKKKFSNASAFHEVPLVEVGTKADLGRAVGAEVRAVIAITESGFAKKLQELSEDFS